MLMWYMLNVNFEKLANVFAAVLHGDCHSGASSCRTHISTAACIRRRRRIRTRWPAGVLWYS